jgi:hypothetical protein
MCSKCGSSVGRGLFAGSQCDEWTCFQRGHHWKREPVGADLKALDRQEGGAHYKTMAIQPAQFIHANGIGFFEASAISYLCRWRAKGGYGDLRKAIHFIELLIELEEKKEATK